MSIDSLSNSQAEGKENASHSEPEVTTRITSAEYLENIHILDLTKQNTKEKIPTKILIKNLIKENIGFEGAQALVRVFDAKKAFFKIFWSLCLLFSNLMCGYLLVQTLFTYLSFQVFTTTTIVHENPAVFPKITICNSAFGTTEYALNLIEEINNETFPWINIFDQNQLNYLSWTSKKDLLLLIMISYFNKTINLPDNLKKKLVHSFDDVLIYCAFGSYSCTSDDFVWKYDTIYGNCYSFNSGFNSTGSEVDLSKSNIPGASFGLTLVVYVGYQEKLNLINFGQMSPALYTNIYGLNLIIENNTYLTDNKWNWITLDGGTINYMSIQRKFSFKIARPYSECDIDNDSPRHFDSVYYNRILNSPYQYSQEFCFIECFQDNVLQKCNCTYPYYFSLLSVSCKNTDQVICAANYFYQISEALVPVSLSCSEQCPLECNSTEYSYSLTSQRSSGYGYTQYIIENPHLSSDFNTTPINSDTASNKFVQLNVYYDSLTYSVSTDTPSMDIVAFLANIGGTLGLFLGLSLLSVCELIYVLVEIVLASKSKIKRNKVSKN